MMLERIRAWALALLTAGADIDLDDVHHRFNAWLESEPERVDPEQAELMMVLGVGRWRR